MSYRFLKIATTPSVRAAQEANGVRGNWPDDVDASDPQPLTPSEAQFIAQRDSFYLATVSETGWPYMQHRGGPKGFLHVLDDRTLAFADFRGNRQYISVGNLSANDRAALFLMDYANRRRLKIYARLEAKDLRSDPELAAKLAMPGYKARIERAFLVHVQAFNWNCPQHITPRFSEVELEHALGPVRLHLEKLQAENKALREQLARHGEKP